jgi:hypothetical protein
VSAGYLANLESGERQAVRPKVFSALCVALRVEDRRALMQVVLVGPSWCGGCGSGRGAASPFIYHDHESSLLLLSCPYVRSLLSTRIISATARWGIDHGHG